MFAGFLSMKWLKKYIWPLQGNMDIQVNYGGDPIPGSPFKVDVAAPLDLSKVKISGLENSK